MAKTEKKKEKKRRKSGVPKKKKEERGKKCARVREPCGPEVRASSLMGRKYALATHARQLAFTPI